MRLFGLVLFAGLTVFVATSASAFAEPEPPNADAEAARRHFERGAALYGDGHYREAMAEFETANTLRPSAGLEFNLARCHERLEEWGKAADAFERFLRAAPSDPEAPATQERIRILRARAARSTAEPPPLAPVPSPSVTAPHRPAPTPSSTRLRTAAGVVGGGALAAALVATGLVASVGADYGAREAACRSNPCSVADLRARLDGGYALFAIAGAAAIADIVLVVAAVRGPGRRAAYLAPAGTGVVTGVVF